MKKMWINFYIDFAMFLLMIILFVTGIIQRYALPPARGLRRGLGPEMLYGWTRHDFGDIHFWISIVLMVLILLHIILHWDWLLCMLKKACRDKQ